jgi:hypothetical protein
MPGERRWIPSPIGGKHWLVGGTHWRRLWCREIEHPKIVLSAVVADAEDGAAVPFGADDVSGEGSFVAIVAHERMPCLVLHCKL